MTPLLVFSMLPGTLRGPNIWLRHVRSPHPLPLKQALVAISRATAGGATASTESAAEAAELISLLERTADIPSWETRGPLMDGAWDQIYTDNPQGGTVWSDGTSARRRLIGPVSGRVLQMISFNAPDTFAYAQRARSRLALGLQAEMRASVAAQLDGVTWAVTFEEFTWSLLGGRLPLRRRKLPPGSGGEWRTTFVDSDTRVLRSQSNRGGAPTTYVLMKR